MSATVVAVLCVLLGGACCCWRVWAWSPWWLPALASRHHAHTRAAHTRAAHVQLCLTPVCKRAHSARTAHPQLQSIVQECGVTAAAQVCGTRRVSPEAA